MKRYGPYKHSMGYIFYIEIYESGKRKSVLEHNDVMERIIGRKLTVCEEVHHKDKNRSNNSPDNLVLKDRTIHRREHALEQGESEVLQLKCVECGKDFDRKANYERHNIKKGRKEGPFCGKKCAGKYFSRIYTKH